MTGQWLRLQHTARSDLVLKDDVAAYLLDSLVDGSKLNLVSMHLTIEEVRWADGLFAASPFENVHKSPRKSI